MAERLPTFTTRGLTPAPFLYVRVGTGLAIIGQPDSFMTSPNPSAVTAPLSSIVYVDGLNLFHRALKGGPNKWLDLVRLFQLLRHQDNIIRIKYFTALISGVDRPKQEAYLQALTANPLIQINYGVFQHEKHTCAVPGCGHVIRDYYVPKEKQTDVRISLAMLADAMSKACDQVILVSGDSDLVPAVESVKIHGLPVIVYVPLADAKLQQYARDIRSAATRWTHLPNSLLPKVQLPNPVPTASGSIPKPAGW